MMSDITTSSAFTPILPLVHSVVRPFFTVIICTYNRASLLPRALDSLLNQTERDWEAVIVDDGSTDTTWQVIQRYAEAHSQIRSVYHSNRGIPRSRNAGVLAAAGLFVTFLDSDDEYRWDHLTARKQMFLEYPTVEFLHGGVEIIGEPYVPDKNEPSRQIHLKDCVIGGTFVIRKDTVLRLGGFDAVVYADDALLYERAMSAGISIARTEHPSYKYYRDTPDSICNTQRVLPRS